MPMSDQVVKDYVGGNGARCPYCGSREIHAGYPEPTDTCTIVMPVVCEYCDANFTETYKLTSVEEVQEGRISCQIAKDLRKVKEF